MVHLTDKQVELAVRAIQYSSRPGENVLDLFGGRDSTLIACERTGWPAFPREVDAARCDVIVKRWEEPAGHEAKRIAKVERTAHAEGEKLPSFSGAPILRQFYGMATMQFGGGKAAYVEKAVARHMCRHHDLPEQLRAAPEQGRSPFEQALGADVDDRYESAGHRPR